MQLILQDFSACPNLLHSYVNFNANYQLPQMPLKVLFELHRIYGPIWGQLIMSVLIHKLDICVQLFRILSKLLLATTGSFLFAEFPLIFFSMF